MRYLILFFLSVFVVQNLEAKVIRIGLIPGNGQEIKTKADQFAKVLSKQVDKKVDIYIPKDYQDLIDAMKTKKVDFAFFTAMSFVYAEQKANAKVLLKSVWDNPYYFSTIITKPDSDISNIKDLSGKKVGFVDKKSTSGYLLPSIQLEKEGVEVKASFTGNHKASMEKLKNGELDAVAVFANDEKAKNGAWNVYFKDHFKPKVLWISQALPTDPFTVREDYFLDNTETTYDVMFALMEMPNLKHNENILQKTLGIQKLITANTAQYRSIKNLVQKLPDSL